MTDLAPRRSLPIFWKLLLPFLVLLLVVGCAGAYVIVRDLGERSAAALTEELTVRVVDARSLVHDRELGLIESVNYAANLEGMADVVRRGASGEASSLLQSVLTLKTDLTLVAVTDAGGRVVSELVRDAPPTAGADSADVPPLRAAIDAAGATKTAAFTTIGGRTVMTMVAPICTSLPCAPVGFALVATEASSVVHRAAAGGVADRDDQDVTIFDASGTVLASTLSSSVPSAHPDDGRIEQRRSRIDGKDVATAYAAFTLAGQPAGTIAVTTPAASVLSSVRSTAARLIAVLIVAMVIAVIVGAAVSRRILHQLHAVVNTSRELGAGNLAARAPVLVQDEHGELAAVLNQMAEQLQAERASLEIQVDQRTEEVRRLLRDRTDFFAGLSHELRTPLAVIATQAELIHSHPGSRATTRGASKTISTSASQLLHVINDILDLARAEAGTLAIHAEAVRLSDVLASVSPMLSGLGASADVRVRIAMPSPDVVVEADPARLGQIVVNLVDNAIKYTPAGGAVDVSTTHDGDTVRISIADTGVGIPSNVGDRVFEPFYSVPSTRPQKGQASSGLGLALVRRSVEAHGGTIEWHDRDSGGTVFTFTVPSSSRARARAVARNGSRGTSTGPEHAGMSPKA